MTILYLDSFLVRFRRQINFIQRDSPTNAKKFAADVRTAIGKIKDHPRAYRQSIYFEDENIRDLVFRGYTITFRIQSDQIEIIGFTKCQIKPTDESL